MEPTYLVDTWHTHERPLLVLAAEAERDQVDLPATRIEAELGLRYSVARAAKDRLERAGYIDRARFSRASDDSWCNIRLSEKGLREIGLWPSPEAALERLITALEHVAATNKNPETREKAGGFAKWLKAAGTDLGVAIAGAAISGQIPGV